MKFEIGHCPINSDVSLKSMTNEKFQLKYGKLFSHKSENDKHDDLADGFSICDMKFEIGHCPI
ncbi:MAG TPA: hypothetical protein PKA34_18620, partial [Blastocatellia bacterium]|nr:hypothetical protein [Blastocatellia bacterium]